MKIRITKKGLPKAQWLMSQPGVQLQPAAQPNYNWMPADEQQFVPLPKTTVVKADGTQTTTGNFGQPTTVYETSNEGTPANQGEIVPQGKKKPSRPQGFMGAMNNLTAAVNLLDTRRKNREIERAYKQSLVGVGPMDYTLNRGDYEINTGMVDPYNTGAQSKGQFANPYFLPMAEEGLTLGPLSYSETPVRRNIYEYTAPMNVGFTRPTETFRAAPAAPVATKSAPSRAANDSALKTWENISKEFEGVKHLGIWGDKNHQKRKSDHNTGDALDIGITNPEQGNQIAQKLIKEAGARNVKYIIWNNQIWNPSVSNSWRPYTGSNPHTGHVHVSFNRPAQSLGQVSNTHNNPLNIHYGSFAENYGGVKGAPDAGGNVSVFPDLNTGIKAAKDLLFGPSYANLTISQARNKWVSGNPNVSNNSTKNIVQSMGTDKKLSDLTPRERDQLIKLFAKWEGKEGYDRIKDMQLYADGGSFTTEENATSMKIRITQEPMENMEYGGQLGYGFDLGGRRVYTDMPESTSESVSDTIGPVPREMATIEAEKGETMLSDVDGDGMKEHMKIGGKRHSEGGTPLAAQPGDFIFSDTARMKIGGPLLKLFGKSADSKKKYTPAQLAKQYDINKYKAILQDPNADSISKSTAEMMLSNYEQKLGLLSFVQEAKKGFPQGVPAVAQEAMGEVAYGGYIPEMGYGGYMEQYQAGGSPKKMTKAEYEAALKRGEFKQVGTRLAERTWKEKVKDEVPGAAAEYRTQSSKAPGKGSAAFNKAFADARKAGLKEFTFNGRKYATNLYTPGQGQKVLVKAAVEGKPAEYVERKEQITFDEAPGIPSVPEFTPTGSKIPYGWTQQDKNNALLAMMNRAGINKYSSVRRDVAPVMPDFRNMDWRGRAAELQGTYNSQLDAMGTYQSPTSLAANASFMAGQQADNLINRAIDPVEQANVNIYNQVAGQRAGIMNQALANSAQNTFLRSQDRAVLNQQYDNAVRDANNAMVQTLNQGITNASGIYNTNLVESPYYFYDPRTQKMQFNSENARAAFEAAQRSAGPNDGDMMTRYMAVYGQLKGKIADSDMHNAVMDIIGGGAKTGRTSSTTYPFNPRMNRTTVQQPFNPYFNPYLGQGMGQ